MGFRQVACLAILAALSVCFFLPAAYGDTVDYDATQSQGDDGGGSTAMLGTVKTKLPAYGIAAFGNTGMPFAPMGPVGEMICFTHEYIHSNNGDINIQGDNLCQGAVARMELIVSLFTPGGTELATSDLNVCEGCYGDAALAEHNGTRGTRYHYLYYTRIILFPGEEWAEISPQCDGVGTPILECDFPVDFTSH